MSIFTMSGLNLNCEIDNCMSEIAYSEDKCIDSSYNLVNVIADEILNEILDNVFDILNKTNNKNWKDSNNTNDIITTDLIKRDHVYVGEVGDIIEDVNKKSEDKEDDMDSENAEPYGVVTYETIHLTGGVGDQAFDDKIDSSDNEVECENIRVVDKKSRVTDLVKNSPQLINEYLLADEKTKRNQAVWEESEESVIQVIELDDVDVVKLESKPNPSVVSTEDDDEVQEVVKVPAEDTMDVIDLNSQAFKDEERQILNSQLAKGDQQECLMEQSPARDNIVAEHTLTEKQSCQELSDGKASEKKVKKKKWHFGTKFWGFLKKNNKNQNTSTSKIDTE